MKEHSKKGFRLSQNWLIVIVIAVIVIVGIYWISIRPGRIRSQCNQQAITGSEQWLQNEIGSAYEPGHYDASVYESDYSMCLHNKGL